MDKASLIQRIDKLEEELEKLKQAFLDHWRWHRSEEQHRQEAATNFHERMGIMYAVAQSRAAAHASGFCFGPTPDLVKLHGCPADEGYVMVMVENTIPGKAPESRIVMEYIDGRWKDVVPPEELRQCE